MESLNMVTIQTENSSKFSTEDQNVQFTSTPPSTFMAYYLKT